MKPFTKRFRGNDVNPSGYRLARISKSPKPAPRERIPALTCDSGGLPRPGRGSGVLAHVGHVPPSTITPLTRALAAAGATGPGLRLLSGVDYLLHPPDTASDDQVLAPSVVAALQAWARPYAT